MGFGENDRGRKLARQMKSTNPVLQSRPTSTKRSDSTSRRQGNPLSSMATVGPSILVLLALQFSSTGCSTDIRRRVVSNPTQGGILLAPDLPTLNALMAVNAGSPSNVIPVPNRTKGLALERRFLRGGNLVDPYPASSHDMERDGAVEVVLFEVTEGPNRGSKGWVQASFLRPDFWYL
jgi:hypothetical protein